MIKMISQNEYHQIKKLKIKKFRNESNLCLVEGENLITQLTDSGKIPKNLLITDDYVMAESLEKMIGKTTVLQLKKTQLEALSETRTPQKVMAIYQMETCLPVKTDFVLYLDDIQDPGNLGTIIRTAYGFGIDAVIVSPGCCEIFSPKVIRSSLGTVFLTPILQADVEWLTQYSGKKVIADLDQAISLYDINERPDRLAIVIGSEGRGVSLPIKKLADIKAFIPMENNLESFNAAVTCAVFLYHFKGLK